MLGTRQVHRTLNPVTAQNGPTSHPAFRSAATTARPPAPLNASVTEATTDLLSQIRDSRVKQPVTGKDPNTADMDTDRLM